MRNRLLVLLGLFMTLSTVVVSTTAEAAPKCDDVVVGAVDADGDGSCTISVTAYTDLVPSFANKAAFEAAFGDVDCDDTDAAIKPGATERYNADGTDEGIDSNCDSSDDTLPETGATLQRYRGTYKTQKVTYKDARFFTEHARCVASANCSLDATHGEFDAADGYLFVDLYVGSSTTRYGIDELREVVSEDTWENEKHRLKASAPVYRGPSRATLDSRYVGEEDYADDMAVLDDRFETNETDIETNATDIETNTNELGGLRYQQVDSDGDGVVDQVITYASPKAHLDATDEGVLANFRNVEVLDGRVTAVEGSVRVLRTDVNQNSSSGFVIAATATGLLSVGPEVTDPDGGDNIRNSGSVAGGGSIFLGGETEDILAGAFVTLAASSDGGAAAGMDLHGGAEFLVKIPDSPVAVGGGAGLWLSETKSDGLHTDVLAIGPAFHGVLNVELSDNPHANVVWITRAGLAPVSLSMAGDSVGSGVSAEAFITTGIGIQFGTASR